MNNGSMTSARVKPKGNTQLMCLSIAPTTFGKTITGLYEADAKTHVIFYQNAVGTTPGGFHPHRRYVGGSTSGLLSMTAPPTRRGRGRRSSGDGEPSNWDIPETTTSTGAKQSDQANGNALVIPLMTRSFKSIKLLAEFANMPNMLKDIRRTLQPVSRGGMRRGGVLLGSKGVDQVQILQYDIYTIVLATRASLIADAVAELPSNIRPPLAQDLFDKLEEMYDCPFAVACFDNAKAGESKPIAFAYTPKYPKKFMIYTLDGHDGKVPDLDATVTLDHVVFVGSYLQQNGAHVSYRDEVPAGVAKYLPKTVVGKTFPAGTRMVNGDILVSVDDAREGNFNAFRVLPPKGPARKPIALSDAYAR